MNKSIFFKKILKIKTTTKNNDAATLKLKVNNNDAH